MEQPSNPTHLREIVVVLIRILAINLGIESFNFLLKTLGGYRTDPSMRNGLLVFGVMAVCTFWLWRLSPFFARLITPAPDRMRLSIAVVSLLATFIPSPFYSSGSICR